VKVHKEVEPVTTTTQEEKKVQSTPTIVAKTKPPVTLQPIVPLREQAEQITLTLMESVEKIEQLNREYAQRIEELEKELGKYQKLSEVLKELV